MSPEKLIQAGSGGPPPPGGQAGSGGPPGVQAGSGGPPGGHSLVRVHAHKFAHTNSDIFLLNCSIGERELNLCTT